MSRRANIDDLDVQSTGSMFTFAHLLHCFGSILLLYVLQGSEKTRF